MARLDASSASRAEGAPAGRRTSGGGRSAACCLECGAEYERQANREFCSNKCRKDWNNRRMKRGAELYDLYMAHRFDRANAQALGVFQAVNRMASNFRAEDAVERAGRRSWRATRTVLEERPYLRAVTTRMRMGRMGV